MNEIVETLIRAMPSADVYPKGVTVPFEPFLRGRAFFQGGSGLFDGADQSLADQPIMVVGQDFDTALEVERLRASGAVDEGQASTWQNLSQNLLAPNGVDPRICFFTNALLGARCYGKNTDPYDALDDDRFVQACQAFFLSQLQIVRPSVVISLGIVPTTLLARWLDIAPQLPAPRAKSRPTTEDLDSQGLQFVEHAFAPEAGHSFAFGWSIHPANFGPNVQHRDWPSRNLKGREANNMVWREAVEFRARCT